MSLRRVLAAVLAGLAKDGFVAEPERDGLVDCVRITSTARQVVQLQCSPPGAFRQRLRWPLQVPPMMTANLLVDHVEAARAFDRPLGAWPAPVQERIGRVAGGGDHWWLLGRDDGVGTASPDVDELAASLLATVRDRGLPFLDDASDPVEVHRRGLAADRVEFAAEMAWLAGDVAAARRRIEDVRSLLAGADATDPTPGQRRLLTALYRLEAVVPPA